MKRYQAEVTVRTSGGEEVTYKGDGVGPDTSGQELLAGAEAAALAQERGGTVISSRVREA
ncbi:hypothetical protein ACFWIY_34660 [Streptomyces sioyaensis]|uniref:hypothetical protein n=1 Tax=Streptomyces sioyaensis TaxID=67364 RepID=UPI00364D1C99